MDTTVSKSDRETSPALIRFLLACFFFSGFSGLAYEILWTRMIVKIIGSAPFAVAIVLTVFMGGLGLGSYLAGRSIDRIKEPHRLVRLYALLELAIGAYGILLPWLIDWCRPLFAMLYNQMNQKDQAESLLREVVTDHPKLYEVHYSLGLLLSEKMQYGSFWISFLKSI